MIGQPIDRVDGPLKVTGQATYSYEEWGLGQPLYGFIVGATIGSGSVTHVDTSLAERAPGVRRVLTHRDVTWKSAPVTSEIPKFARAYPVMASRDIRMFGEPVALVIADTFERARAAASLVDVTYEAADGHFELAARESHAFTPKLVNAWLPPETSRGDFDAAFAAAAITVDSLYTTPYELSQPLEPHNALAVWHGDVVTVHVSVQIVATARLRIAATLGIDPRQVKVVARYVGGGFGSKLGVHAEAILAVIAAREVKQPVKVAATRQQIFQLVGNRPASRQRVRLAADRNGTLLAFGHDVLMKTSYGDDYIEQTADAGRSLYAAPNRRTTTRVVELHLMNSEDVRAPGAAPGLLAIESAMDELAHALQIDPIELRIRNEPAVHPERDIPFSQRRLVECMREGAQRFEWSRRPIVPATVRDGRNLVGFGMAAALYPHFQATTSFRVALAPDGTAIAQSDMTDIGTGTYTIVTQVVAEQLGVPIDRVRVELGHSDYPVSAGSGGSFGAGNSASATYRACHVLRDRLLAAVKDDERSSLRGIDPNTARFSDGRITSGTATERVTEILARSFPAGIDAIGTSNGWDDPGSKAHSRNTYGAHFAEVRVDADTGEIRLHRMLGVFDAGRILNAKTARSQLIGGMIWGVSAALFEEGVVDPRFGSFINRDFAQYLVPVNADIRELDAIMLDGFDDKANELGAKGLGELGICGSGAAIGNAVFNATGVRVREFPITLEKLLPKLPRLT